MVTRSLYRDAVIRKEIAGRRMPKIMPRGRHAATSAKKIAARRCAPGGKGKTGKRQKGSPGESVVLNVCHSAFVLLVLGQAETDLVVAERAVEPATEGGTQ